MPAKTTPGRAGDWLEVHSPGGGPPRRGQIVEVLGGVGHEHYRVHWTDEHESIYFPADGAVVLPHKVKGMKRGVAIRPPVRGRGAAGLGKLS